MSNPVIFKDLPATFPEQDKHKGPAAISSIMIHIVLVTVVIMVPLLMPQRIEHWQLIALMAPLAPPPPPPAAPIQPEMPAASVKPEIQPKIEVDPGAVIMPTTIPKEIARIVEDAPIAGVAGVIGGVPNSNIGALLRPVLLTSGPPAEVVIPPSPPPPPPPPPPVIVNAMPVRVGGNVREPKVVVIVPPVYPKLAVKARVTGTVQLEATVTAEGRVDEIHVLSGNPLLIQAAIDCVKQWRYEPTYLNGEPVSVILTAKVNFELRSL